MENRIQMLSIRWMSAVAFFFFAVLCCIECTHECPSRFTRSVGWRIKVYLATLSLISTSLLQTLFPLEQFFLIITFHFSSATSRASRWLHTSNLNSVASNVWKVRPVTLQTASLSSCGSQENLMRERGRGGEKKCEFHRKEPNKKITNFVISLGVAEGRDDLRGRFSLFSDEIILIMKKFNEAQCDTENSLKLDDVRPPHNTSTCQPYPISELFFACFQSQNHTQQQYSHLHMSERCRVVKSRDFRTSQKKREKKFIRTWRIESHPSVSAGVSCSLSDTLDPDIVASPLSCRPQHSQRSSHRQ